MTKIRPTTRSASLSTPPAPVTTKAAKAEAMPVDQFEGAKAGAVGDPLTGGGAATSWDVSQVTAAEIAALKTSKDATTRRIGTTLAGAKTSYADLLAKGERVVVTTSAGNGGQPVVVLLPPDFDPTRPARVHTHYHGWNATIVDALGHGAGTTARITQVQAADPQTVFVLPECGNAPGITSSGTPAYKTHWANVTSIAQTTEDALAAVGIDDSRVGMRVVSAHSGGGNALACAIDANKDGSGLACDRLELEDCLYGSEQQLRTWSATPNGQAVQNVVYYHGTNDPKADAALSKTAVFGSRYRRVNVEKLPMTASDRPILTDANGKPLGKPGKPVYAYAADAHNRTVGEFMDDREY